MSNDDVIHLIVASIGGASTLVSGLYLRYINKRDTRQKELQTQLDAHERCCKRNTNAILALELWLGRRFPDFDVARYFDKD